VAIIEAMHAALPVVVTRGAGLASMVSATGAGIVTDGSADGLRSALAGLLENAPLRREMGEAGRRAAEHQFSLDAFGARLESFYRSLVPEGVSRSLAFDSHPRSPA
jgi:glycosyltransferase involved in cell wall biosynthesis